MRRLITAAVLTASLALTACGVGATPSRATPVRQVLTGMPELLEFETSTVRQELFREVARASQLEEGNAANPLVLFPISVGGALVAAPGFDPRMDLLQAPDAGTLLLAFEGQWPVDRRDGLQGLSERETAELVARTLLSLWSIEPGETEIAVERASGAPYAAAYVDGILRLNPSFLYLAAAVGPASPGVATQ